jgi:HEPN domain-containing protein
MAEYNIVFSEKLLDAARAVADDGLDSVDAIRTVLYLSSLASEIALKGLLEKAGKPIKNIKARRHNLSRLLVNVGGCQIQDEVVKDSLSWVPATRVRSVPVDQRFPDATVGKLLTGEEQSSSKYPNELRYGDHVRDYPPELKLKAAHTLVEWAHKHWDEIRLSSKTP